MTSDKGTVPLSPLGGKGTVPALSCKGTVPALCITKRRMWRRALGIMRNPTLERKNERIFQIISQKHSELSELSHKNIANI